MAIETAKPADRRSGFAAACEWTPVQLLLLFIALVVIDLACQVGANYLVRYTPPGWLREAVRIGGAIALAAIMVAAYRWLVRRVERRVPDELGKTSVFVPLVTGTAAGAALFVAVYVVLWWKGAIPYVMRGGLSGLTAALAIAIASSVGEEIVIRGALFRLLEKALGSAIALLLSGLIFGLMHARNTGATWVSTLAIVLESGILLGLVYALTRNLWVPIGLHFGWNFTEGGVFGASVSGGANTGLLIAPLQGSPLITGGTFGPEASVATMAVTLVASAMLVVMVRAEGQWRRLRWRLRLP